MVKDNKPPEDYAYLTYAWRLLSRKCSRVVRASLKKILGDSDETKFKEFQGTETDDSDEFGLKFTSKLEELVVTSFTQIVEIGKKCEDWIKSSLDEHIP